MDGNWRNSHHHPKQPNLISLQQCASDILGLEYKEVNHGLNYTLWVKRPLDSKYVVFGPQSTGCKEWPNRKLENLTNMVKELGYEVIVLSLNEFIK